MNLDTSKDYGFTMIVDNTDDLPSWDSFRLARVAEIFQTCETIIDFGDSSRALAQLFADNLQDKKRVSIDINLFFRPHIVADICNLSLSTGQVDGIICAAILEHVYNPFMAVAELYRVLAPRGKLFIYVPWMYHYHGGDKYQDYYRFSRDGIRYLLRDFSQIELCPVRGQIETLLNFIPRFGKRSRFIRWFGNFIRKIERFDERHTSGFNVYAIK